MKLYTKTGDDGGTGLFDGSRVPKDDLRVAAYGDVDELNATIGVALSLIGLSAEGVLATLSERLATIQSELFDIGAELATPPAASESRQKKIPHVGDVQIHRLEGWIDEACAGVPPLRTFILPSGTTVGAQLHVCRTVCRRAERGVVTLQRTSPMNPQVVIYLNRLSDLLFAWSRQVNHVAGVTETPWKPGETGA